MELKVSSVPALSGLVQWSIGCTKKSGGDVTTKGKVTLKLPGVHALKVTPSSEICEVAANVQLDGSGTVTISIESK
jgi:hypothetical protein